VERKSSKRFVPSFPASPVWDEEWPGEQPGDAPPEESPLPMPSPQATMGTCEVWCISPEGYECRLEMPVDGAGGMAAVIVELEAMGFTPRQPKIKPAPRPQHQQLKPQHQQLKPQHQQLKPQHQQPIPPPPQTEPSPPWCDEHGCLFKLFRKNGRRWWAHYDEAGGRWCNSPIPVRDGE